ncbi:hypothetical protein HY484_02390 [Candidatus Woesearchaeota archaeon]|nr:hypothetical protein [Candidatus Woesearchaeota archaeon]
MVKETKRTVLYELTKLSGFDGVEFTDGSPSRLNWPNAVNFANERKAILQSVREAVAFRVDSGGVDGSDDYQATRTGGVYFKEGDTIYLAVDDVADDSKNIVLARSQEGYSAHQSGNEWVLPKKDKHIFQFLKRAEITHRIVEVVESPLELATVRSGGVSEYGQNATVKVLMGDVSEHNAAWLKEHNYGVGKVYTLLPEYVSNKIKDDREVLIRPVGLDDLDVDVIDQFNDSGRARGRVAQRSAKNFSHETKVGARNK